MYRYLYHKFKYILIIIFLLFLLFLLLLLWIDDVK